MTKADTAGNTMLGGRYASGPAAVMEDINVSIEFDKRLYRQDIAGSKAHAAMLTAQGIVSAADEAAIQKGLDQVLAEIEGGTFFFKRGFPSSSARRPDACTPPARATTRWRPISSSWCAMPPMASMPS